MSNTRIRKGGKIKQCRLGPLASRAAAVVLFLILVVTFFPDRAATKAAGGGDGEARGLQLHDVLLALGHVAGHLSATLIQAEVLHPVHLDLPLDDGGVVGDGSLEHGGDRDGDMGSGGLEDVGGGT